MTARQTTSAILLLAGLVAASSALLTRLAPSSGPEPGRADLVLAARLASSHVLRGTSETHLAITLEAPRHDQATRPPVSLAVVIDRSGSMAGDKLEHAKAAARQLVGQLQRHDRIAIVTYGSDVTLSLPSAHATEATKTTALHAIERIVEHGGTNLSGGLLLGREQLLSAIAPGVVQRLVLISDGLANEGIVERGALARIAADTAHAGISITTVGVGLDFDEQTMTTIAVNGRGNYYFAEDAQMLAELFAHELDKLGAITATSIRLSVAPTPGVDVLEAYGYPMQLENGRVIVPVADMHAGETRKVVLRLRVRAQSSGIMTLADIAAAFLPARSTALQSADVAVSATVTEHTEQVLAHRDRDAIRHIERARTAKIINEATLQYEAGNAAGASRLLQRAHSEAEALAQDLGDATLADEIGQAAYVVDRDFAQAPDSPSSSQGKRATKVNRKRAYDLMY